MDVQDVFESVARNSFDVRREVVIRNSIFVTNGVPASTTVLRYIDADTLIRVVILGVVKPEKIADLNHFSVLGQRCDSKSMKSVANGGQRSIGSPWRFVTSLIRNPFSTSPSTHE